MYGERIIIGMEEEKKCREQGLRGGETESACESMEIICMWRYV